jgi:hypothetical protein
MARTITVSVSSQSLVFFDFPPFYPSSSFGLSSYQICHRRATKQSRDSSPKRWQQTWGKDKDADDLMMLASIFPSSDT